MLLERSVQLRIIHPGISKEVLVLCVWLNYFNTILNSSRLQ